MAAMLAATPKVARPAPTSNAQRQAPPAPDRSALDKAERALKDAHERLAHEQAAMGQERAELDRQEKRTRQEGEIELQRLERARSAAERAFQKAGG